jgi:hypothetical protein
LVAIVLTIISSGCQAFLPDTQITKPSAPKYATLKISALDAKTRKVLPTSLWQLQGRIGEVQPKPIWKSHKTEREVIFEKIVPGTYEATALASGYLPKHKVLKVSQGINRVVFLLNSIPPPRSEDALYQELKERYRLKIYRPRYLPPGFKLAPYAGTSDWKTKNPYFFGTEVEIVYESGSGKVVLHFGFKGDIGEGEHEKISVAGHTAYILIGSKEDIDIGWLEKIGSESYWYAVRAHKVPKEEVIKVAKSLSLVN